MPMRRHRGEENEVSSFAPQFADPTAGASQAYLRLSRADSFHAVLGKISRVYQATGVVVGVCITLT